MIKHVINLVVRSSSTVCSLEEIGEEGQASEAVLQIISSADPTVKICILQC